MVGFQGSASDSRATYAAVVDVFLMPNEHRVNTISDFSANSLFQLTVDAPAYATSAP